MTKVQHEVTNGQTPKPADRLPGRGRQLSPEQFEALSGMVVNQAMGLRSRTWAALLDPRRDLDAEFGYPPDGAVIGPEFYRQLYERDAIANKAVQLLPKECWQNPPKIRERATSQGGGKGDGTAFERGLGALNRTLRPGLSWHRPEDSDSCPALNEYWERVDILAGIGSCGILLLGIDDGKGLHEPLAGVARLPDGWARNGELEQEIRNLESLQDGIVTNDYNPPAPDPIIGPNGLPVQAPRRNPSLVTQVKTAALNAQERAVVDSWRQEKAKVENAQRGLEEQGVLAPGGAQAFSLKDLWDWTLRWGHVKRVQAEHVVNAWAKATGDQGVLARWGQVKNAWVENVENAKDAQGHGSEKRGETEHDRDAKAAGSNAYKEDAAGYAHEWVKVAARNSGLPKGLKLFSDDFSDTHAAVGPAIPEVKQFLHEALGREPEPYRTGWLLTPAESRWMGFGVNEQSVTSASLVKRLTKRASTENATPESADAMAAWGNWPNTYGPYPPAESTQYWDWLGGAGTTPTGSPAWSSHGFPAPWDAQGTGQPLGYGAPLGHADSALGGSGNRTQGMGGSPWQGIERQPLGTEAQYLGVQIGPAEMPADEPADEPAKVLFVRPYSQDLFQIVRYEWNVRSPRFCQPVMYRVTLNDPRETSAGGVGLPLATVFVHWSRIVHYPRLTDNAGASEIFAPPVLRPVLNNVLALRKVYGACAEGYFRSGVPGYSFETDPALGGEPQMDPDAMRDDVEQFMNTAQKYLMLNGVSAKMLAPAVVDPTPHITAHLEAICIQQNCPVRVFKGSERGELASSQDDEAWNERKAGRMNGLLTTRLVAPTIDRLIACGALPPPDEGAKAENARILNAVRQGWAGKGLRAVRNRLGTGWCLQGLQVRNAPGEDQAEQDERPSKTSKKQEAKWKDLLQLADGGYVVEWPDLEALGDEQKAQIAQQVSAALATFAGQVSQAGAMTWQTFYTEVLRWPAEKAEAALREAAEAQLAAAAMQPQGGYDEGQGQEGEQGVGDGSEMGEFDQGDQGGAGGGGDGGDQEPGLADEDEVAGQAETAAKEGDEQANPEDKPAENERDEDREPPEGDNLRVVGNELDEPFVLPARVARALAAL